MFDLHSFSAVVTLLQIAVGLTLFAELPIFLFKLLTGRCSFAKDKGRGRSAARTFAPEPEWTTAAFEELELSRLSKSGDAGAEPDGHHAVDPRTPIIVTIARDGSGKFEIPEQAFERIGAAR